MPEWTNTTNGHNPHDGACVPAVNKAAHSEVHCVFTLRVFTSVTCAAIMGHESCINWTRAGSASESIWGRLQARNQLSPKGGSFFTLKKLNIMHDTNTKAVHHWLTCVHKLTLMNACTQQMQHVHNIHNTYAWVMFTTTRQRTTERQQYWHFDESLNPIFQ